MESQSTQRKDVYLAMIIQNLINILYGWSSIRKTSPPQTRCPPVWLNGDVAMAVQIWLKLLIYSSSMAATKETTLALLAEDISDEHTE